MPIPERVSPQRRQEILDALRRGTVPWRGLDLLAVGLDRFEAAVDQELETAERGSGVFKALRGEYGSGKTFFSRWLEHRARTKGFATALVQVSESETPLHRMETVYRRAIEQLQTAEWADGAFRSLIDKWFFTLEDEVLGSGKVDANNGEAVAKAVGDLLEQRLAHVSATQPQFAAALRRAHTARVRRDLLTRQPVAAPSPSAKLGRETAAHTGDRVQRLRRSCGQVFQRTFRRAAVGEGGELGLDLGQGQAQALGDHRERQAPDVGAGEAALVAGGADGGDQAAALIEADRRDRKARARGQFTDGEQRELGHALGSE